MRELVDIELSGKSVKRFIDQRLYSDLSKFRSVSATEATFLTMDGLSNTKTNSRFLDKSKDFDRQRQVYDSLYYKGCISTIEPSEMQLYSYGDLTTEGRCYFSNKEKLKRDEIKRRWGERIWQIAIAVIGVALSILASVITVNLGLGE